MIYLNLEALRKLLCTYCDDVVSKLIPEIAMKCEKCNYVFVLKAPYPNRIRCSKCGAIYVLRGYRKARLGEV